MTARAIQQNTPDVQRPAHADIERIADAVVRTPELDTTVVRFLAHRVAAHWTLSTDEIERRLAARIAHRVAVQDTARLLRSA